MTRTPKFKKAQKVKSDITGKKHCEGVLMRRSHDMLIPLKTHILDLKCFIQAVLEIMCVRFPGKCSRFESGETQAKFEELQLSELHAAASQGTTASRGTCWLLCQELDQLCRDTPCWRQNFLVWGLVLSVAPGSKHKTAEQEDFWLWRHWIICWYRFEAKCANDTGSFWLQYWSLDFSSFPEKECLVLSWPLI